MQFARVLCCDDFPLTKRFPSLVFLRCWGVDADCSGDQAGPYPVKNRRALNPKIHSSRTFLQKRFNTDMSTQIPHTHKHTFKQSTCILTTWLIWKPSQSVMYVQKRATSCFTSIREDRRWAIARDRITSKLRLQGGVVWALAILALQVSSQDELSFPVATS